jgi:hypothetical protein
MSMVTVSNIFPPRFKAITGNRVSRSLLLADLLVRLDYDRYVEPLMEEFEESSVFLSEYEALMGKPFQPGPDEVFAFWHSQ